MVAANEKGLAVLGDFTSVSTQPQPNIYSKVKN
jgi:hypothetical protein